MRRTFPGRAPVIGALVAGAALALVGAGPAPKKKEVIPKVDETIADIGNIVGADVKVEGVGLVMGLDNSGSDPAPSWQRTKLLDEMRKSGVEHPERILANKGCSLVIVRSTVPAGVNLSDKFDLEIELPSASATTSLAGGWLVSTQLAQRASTRDGDKDDKVIATGGGPVMPGTFAKPDDTKVGRVLGGGRVKEDSPYVFSIKESRRSGKTAKLLETVINSRFHHAEGTDRKGAAVAKNDSVLILRVPRTYHHNQDRFFQVTRRLSVIDNPALRAQRLDSWGKDLLDVKKSGIAALRLEGLGPDAGPTIKKALASPDETVRFFAAEALAYLNDNDGDVARVLAETAKKKPEFRSFALKAMAATDQSASLLKLRALMSEPEFELRYGAFDALRTLDPSDPFLGKTRVMNPLPAPEQADEGMSLQIETRSWKKPKRKPDEPFDLYLVDCEGPPMVHVSRNMRCEVVLFGKTQKLLTPVRPRLRRPAPAQRLRRRRQGPDQQHLLQEPRRLLGPGQLPARASTEVVRRDGQPRRLLPRHHRGPRRWLRTPRRTCPARSWWTPCPLAEQEAYDDAQLMAEDDQAGRRASRRPSLESGRPTILDPDERPPRTLHSIGRG